ncbi:abc transporter family protein [Planoprotostelium fungivorum]|uniref:Abc transporter family protein n=1 Tax=Planoprotostelium fungivorum TaxID=1890364 RepID=A0A2P6N609_9EUKA|nr:abc transporter family protein [Planoprotostelium fungivorum]
MFLDAELFKPLSVFIGLVFLYLIFNTCKARPYPPVKKREENSDDDSPDIVTFDIGFKNLSLNLKKGGHKVLDNVSGIINHGRTTAVMGPSGSGKTTFLTTLSGRAEYGHMTGKIYLNGKIDSLKKYPKLVGFVPQEDIMHRDLTVEENLRFSAATRLPKTTTTAQLDGVVEYTMELLGLSEIRHSLIDKRGISGGQRKRVNIGIELVANPSVLFLDEPTSGLDSTSSKGICAALQRLAQSNGINVVAVIHSPRYEIFRMFDDVLLLGKGGKTVYLGPTERSLSYFEDIGFQCPPHTNAADFLLDVVAGEVPNSGGVTPAELTSRWAGRPTLSMSDEHVSMEEENQSIISNGGTEDGISMHSRRRVRVDWQKTALEEGSFLSAFFFGFISLLLPPLTFLSLFLRPSFRSINGSLIGGCGGMVLWTWIPFLILSSIPDRYSFGSLFLVYGFLVWANIFFFIWLLVVIWRSSRAQDPRYVAYFMSSALLPGLLIIIQRVWRTTDPPKYRYAAFMGTGQSVLGIFVIILHIVGPWPADISIGETPMWSFYLIAAGVLLGATQVVVGFHRYQRLPTFDRKITHWTVKIWLIFKRSMVQQSRFYLGFLFDVSLPIFAALFLGVIYYDWDYNEPMGDNYGLSTSFNCTSYADETLCGFLNLPINDPFPGQANLSALSLALAAITSSLRVFVRNDDVTRLTLGQGNEKTVFQRESLAQLSTECYYVGKSLAHLPTVIIAPLCFTLCFYGFIRPMEASFWYYFGLYFAIYFVCSGIAYLVSIVVPNNLAHIVGVLIVLIFMMFSGASPSLGQLRDNPLLGSLLYYPSFLSLFRWTNEIYYLFSVEYYEPSQKTLNLYGYSRPSFDS